MTQTKEVNYNKILLWICVVFFFCFSIGFGILWNNTNHNIQEIKDQNKDYFEKIKTIKSNGPIQIDFKKLNGRQAIINQKDVEKLNNHIDYLSEQVYNESNRAQSLIDKDIDRLNLYMAIGIGFLTIIGIFVPIVINVLNYQDLRDKQKVLNFKFKQIDQKGINKAIIDSAKAITDSTVALQSIEKVKGLNESVKNIEEEMSRSFPKVSTLILQYAITRYFSIVPYLIIDKGDIPNSDESQYIQLLETIRNGFKECKVNERHSISTDESLKSTILDFSFFIRSPKNHQSFLDREMTDKFASLSDSLRRHLTVENKEGENESYNNIDKKLNEIIDSIKHYHDQT